jgi:hypothetical protein
MCRKRNTFHVIITKEFWGLFSREKSGRGVKLTTYLLVSNSIMSSAMPSLPHTPSRRAQGRFYFTLIEIKNCLVKS